MKNTIPILMLLTLFSFSCKKENASLSGTAWKLVKIKSGESSNFEKAEKDYILEFTDETQFVSNLDVNDCGGEYQASEGKISVSLIFCTEICCDSPFAEDFHHILGLVTQYYTRGSRLHLEGEEGEEIVLKKE